MKRFRAVATAVVSVFALGAFAFSVSTAGAETVSSSTKITPKGSLFKEVRKSVDVHLEAKVMPDAGQAKFRELNNVKLNLPPDLTFSTKGTKVCTNDVGQINPENANKTTAAVIAQCPDSVVGGGTATINVAGLVSFPVSDAVLVVFNGGNDKDGNPVLFIQGYSATVVPGGHGVPMSGTLRKGVLNVSVPPLAANSAVSEFTFDLPGTVGLDPNYSQAMCSSGKWTSNAVLTLGTYDANSGSYVDVEDLTTDSTTQNCEGQPGKGAFSAKVSGSKKGKVGKKGTYTVTLKNTGTATAKSVNVAASGKGAKGSASGGTIKPGASKKVKVKVKFTKKGTSKVKFKVTGKGAGTKTATYSVKVK